jgi:hypothetical protein
MKALKIVGGVVGALVGAVALFLALCFLVFWREPDPRETCSNVARFSRDPKLASSDIGQKLCVDEMSRKAYGFGKKMRLASYRRCLHAAGSAAELSACEKR